MKSPKSIFLALTAAALLGASAEGADQSAQSAAASDETIEQQSEELLWGKSRDVFAALRGTIPERADAGFEEGGYVDPEIRLRPLPRELLPSLNPFSELDLHVALSREEVAVVLPRTRRILKVYHAAPDDIETVVPARVVIPPVAPQPEPPKIELAPPGPDSATATMAPPESEPEAPKQAIQEGPPVATPSAAPPFPVRAQESAPPDLRPHAPAPPAQASRTDPPPVRALIERAEARRKIGDILGTRQFLEHAARLGSKDALYLLAQTYDPKVLAKWGGRGVLPDEAKAAKLYSEAKNAAESDTNLLAHAEQWRN